MDFGKYSFKEEIEELADSVQNKYKSEDLEFDECIDDKYTSSVFNKYKNGIHQNKWFLASGSLSIIFGIICVIVMAVVGIVFATSSPYLNGMATSSDFETKKNQVLVCSIIIPIIGIISILVGIKILSFSKYTKSELVDHVGKLCGFAVLQFIFSAFIIVLLTVIGYFVGIGSDYGAIYYNRIDRGEAPKRLADAKILYENKLINEKEYRRIKEDILSDSDII